ncbi:MAG: hypothetical protein KDJ52_36390, partial [Anaerolineae bacterium]|nr:hypothetical protein [Anaerolineae bacterium]
GLAVCEPAALDGAAESGPPSISPSTSLRTGPAGGEADQSSLRREELEGGETPDTLVDNALAAYRAALAINAGAGIVARQRRLFEALAVADTAGVLGPVAEVWGGSRE